MSTVGRFIFLPLILVATSAVAAPTVPPPEPATHPDWANVATRARAGLLSTLFDPGSAQLTWLGGFRWGYTKLIFSRRTYGWVACGAINAKNRMGGYVGAQPFWVMADVAGTVTYGMNSEMNSSCDYGGSGVPVNPELVDISPANPSAAGVESVADELGKLAVLRDNGVITPAEFEAQKAKLLAR